MACTRLHSSTRLPSRCSPLPRSPFLLIAWLPGGRSVEPTMPTRLQARARCHRARQSGRAPVKRKHERRRFTDLMTVAGGYADDADARRLHHERRRSAVRCLPVLRLRLAAAVSPDTAVRGLRIRSVAYLFGPVLLPMTRLMFVFGLLASSL